MADVSAPQRVSALKRAGIALLTAVTCSSVALYANESDAATLGAVAGGAAAGLVSIIYGPPGFAGAFSRRGIAPAASAALVGLIFNSSLATLDKIPPNAVGAGSTAMVIAGASEIIKGSGLAASFDALMSTGVVAVLSMAFAVGIGQNGAYPALIGGAVGLFATFIVADPLSALFGMVLGRILRMGVDAAVPAATAWLRLHC